MNVCIFASGNGTNFEALVKEKYHKINIKLLICDKKDAFVINRAIKYNIDYKIFILKDYQSKKDYELDILKTLKEYQIEKIILAGYMKIIGDTLLNYYPNDIINIHPALLPAFKGNNAIKDAYNYQVKVTGVTIHYVNKDIDGGKIIAQEAIYINDLTIEELEEEIHKVEHKLFVDTIRKLWDQND